MLLPPSFYNEISRQLAEERDQFAPLYWRRDGGVMIGGCLTPELEKALIADTYHHIPEAVVLVRSLLMSRC